jgi:hypothetical protein
MPCRNLLISLSIPKSWTCSVKFLDHHAFVYSYIFNIHSGYTGFVPRARGMLGSSYPLITHMALNEFTDETERIKTQSAQPIRIHREDSPKIDTKPIYPTESGLVPHYTGHIPG